MESGERIWVESILSDEDYAVTARKYPNTFVKGAKKVQEFDCDFKWRKGMGATLPEAEREARSRYLDILLAKHGLKKIET